MDSPRVALFTARDATLILCALMELKDIISLEALTDTPLGWPDGLPENVTASEIYQLVHRLAGSRSVRTCAACLGGTHTDCADEWVDGVELVNCGCAETACIGPGVGLGDL